MSLRILLLSFCTFLGSLAAANDDQYILKPTTAAPQARPLSGAHGYAYAGCWNETSGFDVSGGVRALGGGGEGFADDGMTTSTCLDYCSRANGGQTMQYAGLENGRECWCGSSLSTLSERLNENGRCTISCSGNASEICGGQLALTLYNLTSIESKTGIAWSQNSGALGYGTLAVVTLIMAALM